jgi:hemoglobin
MLNNEVTKDNLNKMVVKFYATVLKDEMVSPFFIEKLGDNLGTFLWKTHIEILTNFWASIAFGDTTYKGNPFAPHSRLIGLKRETFNQWLKLFFETVESIYEPEIAEIFKQRSTFMASNFMRNLRI